MEINTDEIVISSFYGKQSPRGNWLMSAPTGVKIVHLPTGYMVECDDFKSQHKNKSVCIEALRELLRDDAAKEQVSRWMYEG